MGGWTKIWEEPGFGSAPLANQGFEDGPRLIFRLNDIKRGRRIEYRCLLGFNGTHGRLLGIREKTKFRFFVTFEAQKFQTDEGAHRYQQTTRIRKGIGPFKVAFRTDYHTWIECLAVGNIFQGQSHRASQRHSIHFSAKEMSRLLKDFLGKDCCMYRLGTPGRGDIFVENRIVNRITHSVGEIFF